jgi:hypothetical protein
MHDRTLHGKIGVVSVGGVSRLRGDDGIGQRHEGVADAARTIGVVTQSIVKIFLGWILTEGITS